jgi:sulfatase modifying factor 1
MRARYFLVSCLALLCLGGIAQAVTIDTVVVGNAGNTADITGYGSVGYNYNIGKYEVTAGQYTEFLNAVAATDIYGLYNASMWVETDGCNIQRNGSSGSYTYSVANDWANRPVNYVSYWDACRFTNWLGNGQGASGTETGAYTLNGYNDSDGRAIGRNTGWKWAVTSEDEWYKAAYYDPNKAGGAGYWDYPTKSNTAPANEVLGTDPGNSANYYDGSLTIGYRYFRTNVGEFENSGSAYGTFDQGGNVWECNEAIVYQGANYASRAVRGGAFATAYYDLQASSRNNIGPTYEHTDFGFRVSEVAPVPEPSSLIALAGGFGMLLGLRRRKA